VTKVNKLNKNHAPPVPPGIPLIGKKGFFGVEIRVTDVARGQVAQATKTYSVLNADEIRIAACAIDVAKIAADVLLAMLQKSREQDWAEIK
jgi:hypothetical protein